MTKLPSPYTPIESEWWSVTEKLVNDYPFKDLIPRAVTDACQDILSMPCGGKSFYQRLREIGPSKLGSSFSSLMEAMTAEKLEKLSGRYWQQGNDGQGEKDFTCDENNLYSTEFRVSSSRNGIPGCKVQARESKENEKHRQGYYIAVNYDIDYPFPDIGVMIRLGWLDDNDWHASKEGTSSSASVYVHILYQKMKTIFHERISIQ